MVNSSSSSKSKAKSKIKQKPKITYRKKIMNEIDSLRGTCDKPNPFWQEVDDYIFLCYWINKLAGSESVPKRMYSMWREEVIEIVEYKAKDLLYIEDLERCWINKPILKKRKRLKGD